MYDNNLLTKVTLPLCLSDSHKQKVVVAEKIVKISSQKTSQHTYIAIAMHKTWHVLHLSSSCTIRHYAIKSLNKKKQQTCLV